MLVKHLGRGIHFTARFA